MDKRLIGVNHTVYINYLCFTVGKIVVKDNKLNISYYPGFKDIVKLWKEELPFKEGVHESIPVELKTRMKSPKCYMMRDFIKSHNITYENEFELLGKTGGWKINSPYNFSNYDRTGYDRYRGIVDKYNAGDRVLLNFGD